jgi:hypothetical protein
MEALENQISITWDGQEWQVESSIPTSRIKPGETIFTPIPDTALLPEPPSEDPKLLMFPAGTFLYLPLNAARNEEELESIWQAHRAATHPPLAKSPNRPLVPIQLLADLWLEPAGHQHRLASAQCRIAGLEVEAPSLNSIATQALYRFTARETGAIGVFREVRFIHQKALISIDHKRTQILHGTPLPEIPTGDLGPGLFD